MARARKAITALSCMAGMALLLACDSGKEPLAKGAEAEAQGRIADAAALYRAVCDKGSPLCPIATKQAERLKVKEAASALDEGNYKKAKESLDAALASSDAGVKRAAEAMSKLLDLEKGLLWDEVSAAPNQDEALAKVEALAEAGVTISPKAKAWLDQNRPRLLLERVKAACKPMGWGSCVEAGRALSRLYPASPESGEAQNLVDAEYARSYALLLRADALVAQWVKVCNMYELCVVRESDARRFTTEVPEDCRKEVEAKYREHDEEETEAPPPDEPESGEPKDAGAPETRPIDALRKEWASKLEEVRDPFFVRPLEARKALAEKDCIYEVETRRAPAKKK